MKLAVLFSGGKDSCYALFKASKEHDIVCLISIISKNRESYMFHTPNIELTKLQAEAIGKPIICKLTEGKKEEELLDLKEAIKEAMYKYNIEGVVTGALASFYQLSRIKKICEELNLICINPLWEMPQEILLEELIKNNFRVLIVGIFADFIDKKLIGKELDRKILRDLLALKEKYKINPAGEGGEIETFVIDAPFFNKKIKIEEVEEKVEENSAIFIIKKASLVKK
ncbi:MAG: diphthine--ammonia ligase [Candidatus Woesearchaeota archaeon]